MHVIDPQRSEVDVNAEDIPEDPEDLVEVEDAAESTVDEPGGGSVTSPGKPDTPKKPMSPTRLALLFGTVAVVALTILAGWLAFRVHQSQQAQIQRNQFLQVARQGALNLTTIDWQHADADVRRILDSATGEFYGDFAKRSQPFIDVLQQSKAKTVGTVTEAGLESETADTAQALVAVTVQTTNAIAPDQAPRSWRLRITVQKVGDQVKVSNVQFVL